MNETLINATMNATIPTSPIIQALTNSGLIILLALVIVFAIYKLIQFAIKLSWIEDRVEYLNGVDYSSKFDYVNTRISQLEKQLEWFKPEIEELKIDCSRLDDTMTDHDARIGAFESKIHEMLIKVPSIRQAVSDVSDNDLLEKLIKEHGNKVLTIRDIASMFHIGSGRATRIQRAWKARSAESKGEYYQYNK